MNHEDLSPELQAKVNTCKTPEDILALAKSEGYELSDEELTEVTGAGSFAWNRPENCPRCGSKNIYHFENHFYCRDCRYDWIEDAF